jgi:acyl-CoA dehydrogenase
MMDRGEAAFRLIDEVQADAETARQTMPDLATAVWNAAEALRETTEILLAQELNDRFAGAVAYLRAFARVLGGHVHLKAACSDADRAPLAQFAIRRLLPEHAALLAQVREGAAGVYAVSTQALTL